MIKSKKAMIFQILLVMVTIIVLSYALVQLNNKQKELAGASQGLIGSKQIALIKAYQQAEKILFYIDESAKLSAGKAVFELGQNGGHYNNKNNDNKCPVYQGYHFWVEKDKECYPEFRQGFYLFLGDNLNNYLDLYPDPDLPNDNYEFVAYDNKLTGTALEDIKLISYDPNSVPIATYQFKPSFNVKLDYDLDIYSELIENAKNMNELCSGKSDDELEECIKDYLDSNSLKWIYDKRTDRLFLFDAETDNKVIVKFAIEFPKSLSSSI